MSRRITPLLLRAGAYWNHIYPIYYNPYLQKIANTCGCGPGFSFGSDLQSHPGPDSGFKKYERQHLQALTQTFAPKFPQLPPEVIQVVVTFAFHAGFYWD